MRAPRHPYTAIAASVLPGWEVSLAFVSSGTARRLNRKLRGKTYTPNVLSYRVGERSGEIIICLETAERQAPAYAMRPARFVLYLFIHGLLHLEGRRHGTTMERREQALLKKWGAPAPSSIEGPAQPHVPPHRNRNRHRHVPGQNGRRRGTTRR